MYREYARTSLELTQLKENYNRLLASRGCASGAGGAGGVGVADGADDHGSSSGSRGWLSTMGSMLWSCVWRLALGGVVVVMVGKAQCRLLAYLATTRLEQVRAAFLHVCV